MLMRELTQRSQEMGKALDMVVIPQAICSRYALYMGAKTVWIMWFLMVCTAVLAWPISWLLDVVPGEELEITARHRPESLKTDTASTTKGALELNKKHVRDVYTEMKNVFRLTQNQILPFDAMTKIFTLRHSRRPNFRVEGDQDDILQRPFGVGLQFVKDLMLDPDNIPIDVWGSDNLQTYMRLFIVTCQHLVFVKDKSGDSDEEYAGIVTLEDVIEEIGEAVDAENETIKTARNMRKNSTKDMKHMPVSGHSRCPQMMTVTQPFMMKRGGQMRRNANQELELSNTMWRPLFDHKVEEEDVPVCCVVLSVCVDSDCLLFCKKLIHLQQIAVPMSVLLHKHQISSLDEW